MASFLIVLGLIAVGVGSHFHYLELTTSGAAVVGAGTSIVIVKRADDSSVNAGGNLSYNSKTGESE